VERQRPSAPAIDVQVAGTQLLSVRMMLSGAQKPPGHAASTFCSSAGTKSAGRQWAPLHAGAQSGSLAGSMTAAPSHGQLRMTGTLCDRSQPSEQAPVGVVGELEVGL